MMTLVYAALAIVLAVNVVVSFAAISKLRSRETARSALRLDVAQLVQRVTSRCTGPWSRGARPAANSRLGHGGSQLFANLVVERGPEPAAIICIHDTKQKLG